MSDQRSAPRPDQLAQAQCSWCGFDVTNLEAGTACPECATRVAGFECKESGLAAACGLTIAIWSLPILLVCLAATPIVLSLKSDWVQPVVARHTQSIMALPTLALLAGLLLAAIRGPRSLRPARFTITILVVVMFTTGLGITTGIVGTRNSGGQLGYDSAGQIVVSQFRAATVVWSADWLGRVAVPVLWGCIAAWVCRMSRTLGLPSWLSRWAAFALVSIIAAVVVWGTWLAEELARSWPQMRQAITTTQPRVSGGPPGAPTIVPVPTDLPNYARWVNPSSVTAVVYVAYPALICIAAYYWILLNGIRFRLRMASA